MLEKDTVSINLAEGVNQEVDAKVLGSQQVSTATDAVFDKDGRLAKRPGQTSLAASLQGDPGFTNPVAFGSSHRSKVFAHENQLCLINNGNLFTQFEGANKWNFKGSLLPVQVTSQQVDPSNYANDSATVSGITAGSAGNYIYVIEQATGAILSKQALQSSTEIALRVVAFSSALWVLSEDRPGSASSLYGYKINLTTGAVGSRQTLASDVSSAIYCNPALFNNVEITTRLLDCTVSTTAVGEVAFIAYPSSTNIKVLSITPSGIASTLGTLNTGIAVSANMSALSIYCEPSVNANQFYLAWAIDGTGALIACWNVSTSSYVSVFGSTSAYYLPTGSFFNIGMIIEPINNSTLYLFLDQFYPYNPPYGASSLGGYPTSQGLPVYQVQMTLSGTVNSRSTFGYGYVLAGKPVRDTTRTTIYLPALMISQLQSTFMLFDVLEGTTSGFPYIVAKWLYGQAATIITTSISGPSTTWGVPIFLNLGSSNIATLPMSQFSGGVLTGNGYLSTVNYSPAYASQSVYLGKTTHITGGLLWAYDGATLSEHNFIYDPEYLNIDLVAGTTISVTVNTVGSVSAKEDFSVTVAPGGVTPIGKRIAGTPYNYLSFATTAASYYIWCKVDGVGTDPAAAGTGILVSLSSTDTQAEAAVKWYNAITAAGIAATVTYVGTTGFATGVRIVNTSNGVVTAPAFHPALIGGSIEASLAAGSYEFQAVWKWNDRNGNIYRSAPSTGTTITSAGSQAAVVTIYAPQFTNRNIANVQVELYRTQVNTTELQLVATGMWSASVPRVQLTSGQSDAEIAANQIIYTNGGVQENFGIGACSSLSTFKNRLMVSPSDDPNAVYYTKTLVNGEPANFTQFNTLRVDQDAETITAHYQMDDKLCIFKNHSIYVTAGDGSNDLGQSGTFQLPLRLPSDVGCVNPNSLIFFDGGLIFQTPSKGVWLLTRNLQPEYIGGPVDNFKGNQVSGAVLCSDFKHIVFSLQDSTTGLVYNYRFNRWDFWSNQQADSNVLWQQKYVRVTNAGLVFVESSNFYDIVSGANTSYSMGVTTAWLKLKGLSAFQRIYRGVFLGEFISNHTLNITVTYDYGSTYHDLHTYTMTSGPYQVEVMPAIQKCSAIQFAITETPGTGTQQSLYINALDLYVGLKRGLQKLPAAKKA